MLENDNFVRTWLEEKLASWIKLGVQILGNLVIFML